jgi:putative hemolysin
MSTPRATYPVLPKGVPATALKRGKYRMRFARDLDDLDSVLRLRYEVFNLELGEGLESSHESGRDRDSFDDACHHLMVEDLSTDRLVGTYRMQTAEMARRAGGFYTAGEFGLEQLPTDVVSAAMEVGRACVAQNYRNRHVLFLLWRGLAAYLTHNGKRYLFGCCSLTTQDPAEGIRALRQLQSDGHMHPELRVSPRPGLECRLPQGDRAGHEEIRIPILFRTYLRYGAKVCGPPAIDREFKTIDFLVVLDVQALEPDLRRLFF